MLHEIRVSGTVLWSPTNANSPTYTYISQKRVSGNRVSDFRVSGGPPVLTTLCRELMIHFAVHKLVQAVKFRSKTIVS